MEFEVMCANCGGIRDVEVDAGEIPGRSEGSFKCDGETEDEQVCGATVRWTLSVDVEYWND